MAKMSVRQMWAAKLAGNLASPAPSTVSAARPVFVGRVLGIDPSLRGTGLAVVELSRSRQPLLIKCLTVKVSQRKSMGEALAEIHRATTAFVTECKPDQVAMEQTIFVQNFQTAQILGAARGAAMAAVCLHGLDVWEYPPLRMKQAVVGSGRASKEQVARTVMGILGLGAALSFDESDAAGVALCHAFTWRP